MITKFPPQRSLELVEMKPCIPWSTLMYAGAPYMVIQRAMHIHPTVTELIPALLGTLKPLE